MKRFLQRKGRVLHERAERCLNFIHGQETPRPKPHHWVLGGSKMWWCVTARGGFGWPLIRASELQGTLDAIQRTLSEIQHQELRGTVTSDDLNHLSKVVDDTRQKAADKIKITLPLIPYLLQYEHEITLEKGVNLNASWDRLVGWAKGKK